MPRLSVLMPVRNGGDTLRSAVRSTLIAMRRDAELVIYDDASDDDAIATLPFDPRLRVIRGEDPQGVARGLNTLLTAVDAELIARMDADDICLPWRFHHQLSAVDDGADFVFTTVINFGAGISRTRLMPPTGISVSAFPLQLLVANPVAHSTMLGRLDHVRAVGGYRNIPSEDYDLWLRLAAQGARMMRQGLPGLLYRIHPSQITSTGEWLSKAAGDQRIGDSYTELARQYFSAAPDWYPALRAARRDRPIPGSIEPLQRWLSEVEAASRNLPRHQARALLAKCRSIIARARQA